MKALIEQTKEAYVRHFGREPVYLCYAPGRVNLIGEHTDYNGGFVLPCAIRFGTAIWAAPNDLGTLRICAQDLSADNTDEIVLDRDPVRDEHKLWCNYLRGMVKLISARYGRLQQGLDLLISGNIPQGAGLSSSASLEVCFGQLLGAVNSLNLKLPELAQFGQAAEAFVGIKCGIMDQMISACGQEGRALLIDCRSLGLQQVALPEDLVVMVINSNVRHQLVGSEYNDRRQSCEQAARVLNVDLLRDASLSELMAHKEQLDEITFRRARHVITENDRVLEAVRALEGGDLERLAELMYASHCSMRDDFEITIPEIDGLVEIVRTALGERLGAVRMTGGGFGGSVVALVRRGSEELVRKAVDTQYPALAHRSATIFETPACQGVFTESLL